MKNILLILNDSHIPLHLIQAAITIAGKSKSALEAVFLNDVNDLQFGYGFPNDMFLTEKHLSESDIAESMTMAGDIAKLFSDTCKENGVEYKIEIDKVVSVKHLVVLSQFADVIIADAGSDSDEYDLQELLADAHCPLLLIPKNAITIEKIYLAYDGSAPSMHAIKMFSYIFPEYTGLTTTLLQIGDYDMDGISHVNEIRVWTSKHFSNISYEIIKGNARKELVARIKKDSEKALLVMGVYNGSALARLFLKGMAEIIIGETNATLFITHK